MAKTKSAVTAKLMCVFDFAYADCWFSHEAAQITRSMKNYKLMQLIKIHEINVTDASHPVYVFPDQHKVEFLTLPCVQSHSICEMLMI